jgi:hypothetical protein
MRKAARVRDRGFVATTVRQGLALDVGFMFGRSKYKNRTKRLEGINGGNTYCLIYDFKSKLIYGVTMSGKTIPVTWLHLLLTRIAPCDAPGRIICLDLGGETGKNPTLTALFVKHNYITQPTGAGASSQNDSGERPHSSVSNAVRDMLYSAQFSPEYWEYAFYLYLRVHTVLPHGANTISHSQSVMGYPAEVDRLRTFGCLCNEELRWSGGPLFRHANGQQWTSSYFKSTYVYPLLHLQRDHDDNSLAPYDGAPVDIIDAKFYSFGMYRRGGRSQVTTRCVGCVLATSKSYGGGLKKLGQRVHVGA